MKVIKITSKVILAMYQAIDFSSLDSLLKYPVMLWLFYKVRFYTMVDIPRLKALFRLVRGIDTSQISGEIVECGVYKGGSAAVMAYATKSSPIVRDIWLFDSFEGLPPPTKNDGPEAFKQYYKGICMGTVREVREIFRELNILDQHLHIIKGWFQETLPAAKVAKIALLHIDVDWYESVKICLDKFYDNVTEGGFIVLDDYNCWEGCKRATNEFLRKRNLKIRLIRIDNSTASYFQKPFLSQPNLKKSRVKNYRKQILSL